MTTRGATASVRVHSLNLPPPAAAALGSALGALGWRMQAFEQVDDWLASLKDDVPDLLLTRAAAVPAVAQALDSLSLQDPRMASVQLVAFASRDQRLPAELAGADLVIEDTRIDAVLARLREWVAGLDRSPFRVLLIDDDAEARLYASTVLGRVGMQVEAFDEADAALARARDWRPDLVLLDLYMPGLDGLAVTRRLRAELQPQPQVVVLSGEERQQARFNALRVGVDDFLTKPIRPRVLIAAVRSRIKRARMFQGHAPNEPVVSGTRLRRGDFLQRLRQRQSAAGGEWRVLAALRVDGAAALRERLGLGGTDALERALAERIEAVLGSGDCYALWEELGFGVLIERAEVEAVRSALSDLLEGVRSQAFDVGAQPLQLGLSIGYALPPRAQADPEGERWIASAFAAVSVAAQLGGNRAEGVLSRDPDALPPERVLVIRHALAELARGGSLRLEFQPLLRLRGERSAYALITKLRDLRAPLQGYTRAEFLGLARVQGQLSTIDRMALFNAFEAVTEQRQRGRRSSLMVPLDLASVDARQIAWIEAELKRRPALLEDLWLELDADALQDPAHAELVARLVATGLALAASSRSPSLDLLEQLSAAPVQLLRLPQSTLQGPEPAARIAAWHALGRELLIDRVDSMAAVSGLWSLGVDYLQGDALAAASPRLDFEGEVPEAG